MLQLYFWPMACSLASRIALLEAGLDARYHLVDIFDKKVLEDGIDFWSISPKGAVPVLVLDDGQRLTKNAAVLQYIADRRPDLGLAPPAGDPDRYRLQEWLSFIGAEIHKGFLFPTFWYANDAAKASSRERIGKTLSIVAAHLDNRQYLVGERFTVADAYLIWALLLIQRSRLDLAAWPALVDYLDRMQRRPLVEAAIDLERQMRKTFPQQMRKTPPATTMSSVVDPS
jgi:glutathione S-transferase